MKILLLANKLPFPPRDGGSIATLQMLLGLQQTGNELCCLAMNTHKHSFPMKKIPSHLSSKIRFLGVDLDTRIRPLPLIINLLFSKKPYIAQRFNKPAFRRTLRRLLQEETFDIIQLEGPYLASYLSDIRRNSTARVSLRAHNLEYLIWQRMASNQISPLKKWYLSLLSRRLKKYELNLASQVDCLVPISKQDELYFRKEKVDTPMLTIATGLNLDEYPMRKDASFSTLFFIGALDWLPNQEGLTWFLDRVFNQLIKEAPGIHLHVAGRNAPAGFLGKLEHPHITFHGEVEDAREFMQAYGIMVAPLFSGSGIRIKILEAMALGLPVVTTSTGIEGIPASHLPSVMVSDQAQEYKELLLKLITHPKEAGPGVEKGRELISREFNILELSKRLLTFYQAQA